MTNWTWKPGKRRLPVAAVGGGCNNMAADRRCVFSVSVAVAAIRRGPVNPGPSPSGGLQLSDLAFQQISGQCSLFCFPAIASFRGDIKQMSVPILIVSGPSNRLLIRSHTVLEHCVKGPFLSSINAVRRISSDLAVMYKSKDWSAIHSDKYFLISSPFYPSGNGNLLPSPRDAHHVL